jgi:hypothetical protein
MRAVPTTYRLTRRSQTSRGRRHPRSIRIPIFIAVLTCLVASLTRPSPAVDAPAPRVTAPDAAAPATQPAEPVRRPRTRPSADAVARAWAELTHRDPAVREAARLKLMGMDADQLPDFRKLVATSRPLAPSQAIALHEIVTQVYLAGQTYESTSREGFLGVRLADVNISLRPETVELPNQPFAAADLDGDTHGVVIVERMPGFCGARAFQDGDIILAIDERPEVRIGLMGGFTDEVKRAGAGRTIHFRVLRQGRVTRVPLTLDVRPADADRANLMDPIRELQDERDRLAREYWNTEFAPLLKETVG